MSRASPPAAAEEQLQLGTDPKALPFLKWVGGKRQLVPTIRGFMPKKYGRYMEPFVGGGALFFDVAPDSEVHGRAYLGDVNEELLTAYHGVWRLTRDVVKLLGEHATEHARLGKPYYLQVRSMPWDPCGPDFAAARMIYLNKTNFNGLYRVNKQGRFNVPMGKSKTPPRILDEPGLFACAAVLGRAQTELHHCDYERVYRTAERGDFVYFDPPYDVAEGDKGFTEYAAGGFGVDEQKKLAEIFRDLTDDGVYCVLSNADTPLVRKLYEDFPIREVSRAGTVSSKADGRGRVGELLIRGWAW